MKEYLKRNWKLILNIFTFVLLGAAIYLMRHDIIHVFEDLSRINAIVLLLLIPLQFENFVAYAHLYQEFLRILGNKQPFKRMMHVAMELNFVNHVFPSGGVSGFSYFAARLRPHGVTTAQATLTQSMRFVLVFADFVILLFIGLFFLALGGSASNMTILLTCTLAFSVVFAIIVGTYVVSDESRIHTFSQGATKVVNKLLHFFRRKHPETIKLKRVEKTFTELHGHYKLLRSNFSELRKPFFYANVANITELATIYTVYIAYGQFVNPGAVIIAYAIANFAGLVAVLPGGIGIYEGLMTLVMVSAGVPAALSLSVTIMYRVLTMGLSLPIGYYYYNRAIKRLGTPLKPQVT